MAMHLVDRKSFNGNLFDTTSHNAGHIVELDVHHAVPMTAGIRATIRIHNVLDQIFGTL